MYVCEATLQHKVYVCAARKCEHGNFCNNGLDKRALFVRIKASCFSSAAAVAYFAAIPLLLRFHGSTRAFLGIFNKRIIFSFIAVTAFFFIPHRLVYLPSYLRAWESLVL